MPFPPPALGGEEHRLRVVRASKDATIGVDIAKGKDSTVVVEKVKPGTAAAEANILPGDLLRTVGGVELRADPDIMAAVTVLRTLAKDFDVTLFRSSSVTAKRGEKKQKATEALPSKQQQKKETKEGRAPLSPLSTNKPTARLLPIAKPTKTVPTANKGVSVPTQEEVQEQKKEEEKQTEEVQKQKKEEEKQTEEEEEEEETAIMIVLKMVREVPTEKKEEKENTSARVRYGGDGGETRWAWWTWWCSWRRRRTSSGGASSEGSCPPSTSRKKPSEVSGRAAKGEMEARRGRSGRSRTTASARCLQPCDPGFRWPRTMQSKKRKLSTRTTTRTTRRRFRWLRRCRCLWRALPPRRTPSCARDCAG